MATLNLSITGTEWVGSQPTLWDEALWEVSTRLSISDQLAGDERSGAAIVEKFDLTKKAGQTITFTIVDPLIGEPVSGRTAQEGSEEDTNTTTASVTVTHYRHATATDELSQIIDVFGRQWQSKAAEMIGDWFARRKDDDWMDRTLNTDTIQTLYAGSATSRNNIQPGAYLLPHELRRLAVAAERRGAQPIKTFRTIKSTFPMYCALMSEIDYYNLVNDANFRQDVRLAEVRGADNAAISGRVSMYQGLLILRLSSVIAGTGFHGSYLRPEARLRTALTAAATTINIGPVTQKTGVDYGKYFSQTGSTQLLLVDAENISYTGAAATDPSSTGWATVSRAENGTTAATHSAGTLITQNNLGKVLVFGKNVTKRAWALKPRRIHQERDYGFEKGMGIQWIYGLLSTQWSDATVANAVVLETYSTNPNTA
mgnify:FL=1